MFKWFQTRRQREDPVLNCRKDILLSEKILYWTAERIFYYPKVVYFVLCIMILQGASNAKAVSHLCWQACRWACLSVQIYIQTGMRPWPLSPECAMETELEDTHTASPEDHQRNSPYHWESEQQNIIMKYVSKTCK